MQRITISLDDKLMQELDKMFGECGYQNRSEAIVISRAPAYSRLRWKRENRENASQRRYTYYDHAAREMSR